MLGPIGRFLVIGGRVVSWPLTALMTDAPLAALVATMVVAAIAVWCGIFGRDREREAARWLGLGLLWTALALTFISPSLATVIPGLPTITTTPSPTRWSSPCSGWASPCFGGPASPSGACVSRNGRRVSLNGVREPPVVAGRDG